MNKFMQKKLAVGLYQEMHVIRHNHISQEIISLSIKMFDC